MQSLYLGMCYVFPCFLPLSPFVNLSGNRKGKQYKMAHTSQPKTGTPSLVFGASFPFYFAKVTAPILHFISCQVLTNKQIDAKMKRPLSKEPKRQNKPPKLKRLSCVPSPLLLGCQTEIMQQEVEQLLLAKPDNKTWYY